VKVVTVTAGIAFPHAAQALHITRRTRTPGRRKWSTEIVYAITDLTAVQAQPQPPDSRLTCEDWPLSGLVGRASAGHGGQLAWSD